MNEVIFLVILFSVGILSSCLSISIHRLKTQNAILQEEFKNLEIEFKYKVEKINRLEEEIKKRDYAINGEDGWRDTVKNLKNEIESLKLR